MDVIISSPAILLLEHDITIRYPLAEYLRECGFTVFEASGAETPARIKARALFRTKS